MALQNLTAPVPQPEALVTLENLQALRDRAQQIGDRKTYRLADNRIREMQPEPAPVPDINDPEVLRAHREEAVSKGNRELVELIDKKLDLLGEEPGVPLQPQGWAHGPVGVALDLVSLLVPIPSVGALKTAFRASDTVTARLAREASEARGRTVTTEEMAQEIVERAKANPDDPIVMAARNDPAVRAADPSVAPRKPGIVTKIMGQGEEAEKLHVHPSITPGLTFKEKAKEFGKAFRENPEVFLHNVPTLELMRRTFRSSKRAVSKDVKAKQAQQKAFLKEVEDTVKTNEVLDDLGLPPLLDHTGLPDKTVLAQMKGDFIIPARYLKGPGSAEVHKAIKVLRSRGIEVKTPRPPEAQKYKYTTEAGRQKQIDAFHKENPNANLIIQDARLRGEDPFPHVVTKGSDVPKITGEKAKNAKEFLQKDVGVRIAAADPEKALAEFRSGKSIIDPGMSKAELKQAQADMLGSEMHAFKQSYDKLTAVQKRNLGNEEFFSRASALADDIANKPGKKTDLVWDDIVVMEEQFPKLFDMGIDAYKITGALEKTAGELDSVTDLVKLRRAVEDFGDHSKIPNSMHFTPESIVKYGGPPRAKVNRMGYENWKEMKQFAEDYITRAGFGDLIMAKTHLADEQVEALRSALITSTDKKDYLEFFRVANKNKLEDTMKHIKVKVLDGKIRTGGTGGKGPKKGENVDERKWANAGLEYIGKLKAAGEKGPPQLLREINKMDKEKLWDKIPPELRNCYQDIKDPVRRFAQLDPTDPVQKRQALRDANYIRER